MTYCMCFSPSVPVVKVSSKTQCHFLIDMKDVQLKLTKST